jgi:hypothetical protein
MLPSRGKLAADLSEFKLAFLKVDIEITELPPLRQKEAILAGQLDLGYTYGFQYTRSESSRSIASQRGRGVSQCTPAIA